MKFNQKLVAVFVLVIGISILSMNISAMDQPFMEAAKNDLEDAMKSLKKADADKGGHREKAIDLVSRAIDAVKDGIKYDKEHRGNRPRRNSEFDGFDLGARTALPDQPNMVKARESLQKALANLQRASADKGGYGGSAIDLVKNAIAQVNEGIAFDRNH